MIVGFGFLDSFDSLDYLDWVSTSDLSDQYVISIILLRYAKLWLFQIAEFKLEYCSGYYSTTYFTGVTCCKCPEAPILQLTNGISVKTSICFCLSVCKM